MEKLSNEQLELLKKPLPSEAITQHPTKTFLSSIKAIYVTERMNDVFGVGLWSTKVEHVTTTDKSMVVVKVIFEVPAYGIYYECFGGNDNGGENSKNFDLGDAFKGATTDAITKIGSYLGIGIDVFKGKVTANQNTQQSSQSPSQQIVKRELTQEDVKKWNGKIYNNKHVFIDNVKIEPSKEQIEKLKTLPNYKQ